MFSRQKDLEIAQLSKRLAESLNKRGDEDALRDANFSLAYGQYDGFVSNVVAAWEDRAIIPTISELRQLVTLIRLMDMGQEIKEMREFIRSEPSQDTAFGY